jgi:hypothetical protein
MVSAEHLKILGYTFDCIQRQWIQSEKGVIISKHQRIVFEIEKVRECGGTISIEGSNPSLTQV